MIEKSCAFGKIMNSYDGEARIMAIVRGARFPRQVVPDSFLPYALSCLLTPFCFFIARRVQAGHGPPPRGRAL